MPAPSSAILAAAIKGDPPPPEQLRLHSLNTRVPYGLLASIDVMCQRSGKSRNAICNDLLTIGIDQVLSHFDLEDRAEFQSVRDELVSGYIMEDEYRDSETGEWGVR